MNHKQYEIWILDEPELTAEQKARLKRHLSTCPKCHRLKTSWHVSKKMVKQTAMKTPVAGFAMRWQALAEKKCRAEKVRRYRLTLFSLLMLAFAASLTYMIVSGSILQMFANLFNAILRMIIGITNGLSTLGYWLGRLPIAVPLTIGFIFFGLINAFIMMGLFTLWNLKQRKPQTNEIRID